MEWLEVSSSSIAAVGYDPKLQELGVEFRRDGRVYVYFGVSQAEYDALIQAESKGDYLNRILVPKGHRYKESYRRPE